jgi:hypothetical protein
MGYLRDEILQAGADAGIQVRELSQPEAASIRQAVRSKFAQDPNADYLWKELRDDFAVQDANAWRWIDEFVVDRRTVMFFDEREESSAFEFERGVDVVRVLEETIGFEFYLTNHTVDYVICFNHHDYLIAVGTAAEWLKRRVAAEQAGDASSVR